MKKLILLFSMLISLHSLALASKTGVFMDFYKKGHDQSNTQVNRAPMRNPPIEVIYDSVLNSIEITCSEPIEAEIYLYDESGIIVGYASTLNSTLQLPLSSQKYYIKIEGDSWYAIGEINKNKS